MKLFKKTISIIVATVALILAAGCNTISKDSPYYWYKFPPENVFDQTAVKTNYEGDLSLPYKYYLPKINIVTEDNIDIDDKTLIDKTRKKGINHEIPVYNYVNAMISVNGCGEDNLNNVSAQVKVRGNYTATYEKKPIKIKFSKKQSLCGINGGRKYKDWVLLSEYRDSSMLRNSVAYYMSHKLFKSDNYCSDYCYVEVFLNNRYYGLFLLCEQQEVKEGRVDIDIPLDPDDYPDPSPDQRDNIENVKTGYFIEYDGYYEQEDELHRAFVDYFPSLFGIKAGQTPVKLHNGRSMDPKRFGIVPGFTIHSEIYFESQRKFLEKCMQTIWNVVLDATYSDHSDLSVNPYHTMDEDGEFVPAEQITSAKDAVAGVIDIDSLISMYLIQELFADSDLNWSSFYFSLDMSENGDRKLRYTAPWDFDSSMGLTSGASSNATKIFAMDSSNPWIVVFNNQKWFWDEVNALFEDVKNDGVFDELADFIDKNAAIYCEAYARNFARWPKSIGSHVPGGFQVGEVLSFKTESDAAQFLKEWLAKRIEVMPSFFNLNANLA